MEHHIDFNGTKATISLAVYNAMFILFKYIKNGFKKIKMYYTCIIKIKKFKKNCFCLLMIGLFTLSITYKFMIELAFNAEQLYLDFKFLIY